MPHHLLTNFGVQRNDPNELKFNGIHSRNDLPKIKDQAYVLMSTNQL